MTKPKPLCCPVCQSERSRVIESRDEPRNRRDQLAWTGHGFWRRRRCERCSATFTTKEIVIAVVTSGRNM